MRKRLLLILTLFLAILGNAVAQDRTITGTVTSAEDGSPLPGVNILVSGTTNVGTITDANGRFSLKVPEGFKALEFSYIGTKSQAIELTSSNVIDVSLEMEAEMLSEVVVTALGIKRDIKAIGFAQQELSSDELAANRELNISNFLTAKIAGVQVSKTASGLGGSTVVNIRGNSSLTGNNQPLYVVDGVPITNESHSGDGVWGDRDYGDGVGDINPEDVESMTVLKGPNASALYGARGSNGVVLITTKSGTRKKGIGVEINSNVSIDKLNLFPTFQNYYATGYEETNIYGSLIEIPTGSGNFYETMDTWHGDSWGPPMDGNRTIIDPFVYPGTEPGTLVLLPQPENNVKEFYEVGVTNTNNIAISGGTEKSTARLSIGNTWAKGIIPNHRLEKQTISLRTNTQVTDFLSFDAKINYIHDEGHNRPALGTVRDNVTRGFATLGRYVPLPWLKEYYETTGQPGNWPGVSYNPYYVVNELKNNDSQDRIIGFASANLKITPWLSMMGRVGTDFYTEKREEIWPVGAFGGDNANGRLTSNLNEVKDFNADVILTASKELSSHFSLSGSVGSSILRQTRNYNSLDARNLKAEGVYHVSNAQDIRPNAFFSEKEMQSVYFTGQVAYNNYLFLDVTGRNDWSSALGRDNYSFFYPSVSTSFVFTDAFRVFPEDILSFGKVRLSWAQVGNDSDPYLTRTGYNSFTTSFNGQGLASVSSMIPLFNLKNELTESWEIGADLRFLNNRLGLDLTYYNGKTTNQILPVDISIASGYSSVVINAGEIQNKGLEVAFRATPIKTNWGLSWEISGNYARNHSNVVTLAPGIETYTLGNDAYASYEARPGHPFGDIIGYKYKRSPSGEKIVGSGGGYVREDVQSVLGNITPDWIGGLNNTISYKGLSFNFLLDFVQGKEINSGTKYQQTAKGTGVWTTEGRRLQDKDQAGNQLPLVGILPGVVEIVDGEGNVTGYEPNTKAVDGQTYWANRAWSDIGEEFVLDGSYIMLREVMLSYSFKPELLGKVGMTGLTLTLVGRNLWYIEEHMEGMGVSPESAPNTSAGFSGSEVLSMPTTRTFGLNVKITF